MRVSLTEALEKYVRDQVADGLYTDASEVIREALRLKMAADRHEAAKLEALRAAIDEGEASIEAGRFETYHPGFLGNLDDRAADMAAR